MVGIGVLFYFIVMRPQMKAQKDKRKQHEDLGKNLKKNDKVVTVGGILGTVAEVTGDRVTLKTDDNTRIRFTRSSIQEVLGDNKEANKDDTDK
jgi:preprotein translocase subunit YajC